MKFIRGQRDHLGVPLEEDEEIPIATAWDDEELFEGVVTYRTPLGHVVVDDVPKELQEFFSDMFGSAKELTREEL